MIKENQKVLNIINVITDFFILFLSYIGATYIRFFCMYVWYEEKVPALWVAWNQQYFVAALLFALVEIVFFMRQMFTTIIDECAYVRSWCAS